MRERFGTDEADGRDVGIGGDEDGVGGGLHRRVGFDGGEHWRDIGVRRFLAD